MKQQVLIELMFMLLCQMILLITMNNRFDELNYSTHSSEYVMIDVGFFFKSNLYRKSDAYILCFVLFHLNLYCSSKIKTIDDKTRTPNVAHGETYARVCGCEAKVRSKGSVLFPNPQPHVRRPDKISNYFKIMTKFIEEKQIFRYLCITEFFYLII